MYNFSELDVDKVLSDHQPLLFKGCSSDPALSELFSKSGSFLMNKLKARVGSENIFVMSGLLEDGGLLSYANPGVDTKTRNTLTGLYPFNKFAKQVLAMSRDDAQGYLYTQLTDIGHSLPGLLPMITPLHERLNIAGESTWNFWIGSGKHRVNTHYDKVENFYFVLHGKKIFDLFPPQSLPELYSGPYEGGPSGIPESVVDANTPDVLLYPEFSNALTKAQRAEVCTGDMLYLPANWWHNVRSDSLNISANLWWSDIPLAKRMGAELAFLQLLSRVKMLPVHWKEYWSMHIDHYVFCKHGDPLGHLPVDQQGIAGEKTEATLKEIKEKIQFLEQELLRCELDVDIHDERLRLKCSERLSTRIKNTHDLELCLDNQAILTEDFSILELLKVFSQATPPLKAYNEKVAESYEIKRFAEKLVQFLRYGVLVASYES